jgi:hypothetical protein
MIRPDSLVKIYVAEKPAANRIIAAHGFVNLIIAVQTPSQRRLDLLMLYVDPVPASVVRVDLLGYSD